MNNLNAKYIGFTLIAMSSFSNHRALPVSPSVIFWLIGVIVLFKNQNTTITKRSVFSFTLLLFSVYLILSQSIIGAPIPRIIGTIISISFYPFVIFFLDKRDKSEAVKFGNWFINAAIIILIIECLQRVFFPMNVEKVMGYEQFGDYRWIYRYKEGSYMYFDSNGTAIHLLIVLFFTYYLNKVKPVKYFNLKFLILTALVVLTFSRAGILSMIGGFVYLFLYRGKSFVYKFIIISICSIGLLISLSILVPIFLKDLSFQTKIQIVLIAYDFFSTASIEKLLFGIGIANSIEEFGIYTHNIILTYLIETGFVGAIFQFTLFYLLVKKYSETWIVFVPFLIATITSMNTYIPYLYVPMALIYILENNRGAQKEIQSA
ncbi:MAG: O-antigen ligase family protein [Candidatus Atribacteria bacterium]|nr:O-antigen ligase family protein [Candidatus Atribacteria bacterium]